MCKCILDRAGQRLLRLIFEGPQNRRPVLNQQCLILLRGDRGNEDTIESKRRQDSTRARKTVIRFRRPASHLTLFSFLLLLLLLLLLQATPVSLSPLPRLPPFRALLLYTRTPTPHNTCTLRATSGRLLITVPSFLTA